MRVGSKSLSNLVPENERVYNPEQAEILAEQGILDQARRSGSPGGNTRYARIHPVPLVPELHNRAMLMSLMSHGYPRDISVMSTRAQ